MPLNKIMIIMIIDHDYMIIMIMVGASQHDISKVFCSGENSPSEQAPLLPLLLLDQLLLLHVLLLLLLPHPAEEHQEERGPNHEDGASV